MAYTFTADGKECWLDTAEPARAFHNMLYNDSYFTMIDQCGCGPGRHLKDAGDRYYKNNVISSDRLVYVRDDATGEYFSVGFGPVFREYQSYRCGSGPGYQTIENTTLNLKVTWRIYVPAGDDPVEVWDVRVQDVSGKGRPPEADPESLPRKVSIFTAGESHCDGTDSYTGSLGRLAKFEPAVNGIVIHCGAQTFEEIDFPTHHGFITADRPVAGFEANMRKFIGPRRTWINPVAVEQGGCGGHHASMQTPTLTLHVRFDVPAGGQADTRFLVGACAGVEGVQAHRDKYLRGGLDADAHFDALAADRAAMMANIQVQTPDQTVDRMLNLWVKQQVHYGATWCRWGWFGYRDIVQQCQGVITQDAPRASEMLRRACAHQYADGFALRGWNPLDPMRYSDSAQWMISAVTEYVKETGDIDFVEKSVPYLDEGEASVYDHLMQAMARLHEDRGAHGLCLIFFGDWNDSLTAPGRGGKGESVWLSMALCRDAMLMGELAEHLGRGEDAKRMRAWHAEMARAVNNHAWDGEWYIRALDDAGQPIGSQRNDEGKIYLVTQAWAQLGRVASDERFGKAWASVLEQLDSGWGLKLLGPTYTRPHANVGRLAYARPGICENGSVYTHGNAFMFLALLERGMADAALKLWHDVHPGNPRRPVLTQPNVFANGFFGPDNDIEVGRAEHMWVTGSASWLFMGAVEFMLGLRRGYEGLSVRPCMPSSWKTASITRVYRGTTYHVRINNPANLEAAPVKAITVDGVSHGIDQVLPIDGGEHEVVVELHLRKCAPGPRKSIAVVQWTSE